MSVEKGEVKEKEGQGREKKGKQRRIEDEKGEDGQEGVRDNREK